MKIVCTNAHAYHCRLNVCSASSTPHGNSISSSKSGLDVSFQHREAGSPFSGSDLPESSTPKTMMSKAHPQGRRSLTRLAPAARPLATAALSCLPPKLAQLYTAAVAVPKRSARAVPAVAASACQCKDGFSRSSPRRRKPVSAQPPAVL